MGIIYELKVPIEFGEKIITDIVFKERPPKLGDLKPLDKCAGKISETIAMVAICSDLTPPEAAELDMEDIGGVSEILGNLLPASLQTG